MRNTALNFVEILLTIIEKHIKIEKNKYILLPRRKQMKIIISIFFFALFVSNLMSLNKYSYDANDYFNIIIEEDNSSIYFMDIINYLENRYKQYNLKLETNEILFQDKNGNNHILLEVNIITNAHHGQIFNGPAHSSLIIDEIILNILQPGIVRDEYPIDAILLQLNGKFMDNIKNDMEYNFIVTIQDATDMVYEYLNPGK
jgi:hypothetical protein